MSDPLLWLIGAGGFLGSHVRSALLSHIPRAALWTPKPARFSWSDPIRLTEELASAVDAFADAVRERMTPWGLLWCAGIGVVSSSAEALKTEHSCWVQLLDLIGERLVRRLPDLPGAVFLASSAGGVYGGNTEFLLTEATLPQPNTVYGQHKLLMEEVLAGFGAASPNVSSLIGRISSLYGVGQNLRKAQGIIAHLSRCMIYRHPVNIYVSLDTKRDYLYAADCADQICASFNRLFAECSGSTLVKILAAEELTSLARIKGIFFTMAKRRPLIVSAQPRQRTQTTSLNFRSEIWRDLPGIPTTDLAIGIRLVHQYQLGLFRRGVLPAPV
jgi:UDP-glucose 4-epimerase